MQCVVSLGEVVSVFFKDVAPVASHKYTGNPSWKRKPEAKLGEWRCERGAWEALGEGVNMTEEIIMQSPENKIMSTNRSGLLSCELLHRVSCRDW